MTIIVVSTPPLVTTQGAVMTTVFLTPTVGTRAVMTTVFLTLTVGTRAVVTCDARVTDPTITLFAFAALFFIVTCAAITGFGGIGIKYFRKRHNVEF